ncbi:hypothetical protein AVEN_20089-1 [Araneus ventricosus]|uniref:Uncharacterized protein n=1 Tax=Araneus ventricosus TaxID=182803 RepID=A0A4Y2K4W4_ARAVE|nr:hypothetical protein AVEN_140613-1 [Araneus ventricosus]GBM97384.1 hypothetical protein AVEN_20089-1 [Araneus ventricosus]
MNKSSPLTSFRICLRSIFLALLECHISRTMDRTWRTCGMASSLTGPQPTGLFLLGTPVDSAEDLVARIIVAGGKINATPGIFKRVRQSFLRRCELCNDTRGRHSEHFLRDFI